MKILIVEDDPPKRDAIISLLISEFPNFEIVVASSVNSASRRIEEADFNLVILDMSLPNFDFENDPTGGRPINYGGEDVLDYISTLKKDTKVVIISQYPKLKDDSGTRGLGEIGEAFSFDYPEYYLGIIYYNTATGVWKKELINVMEEVNSDRSSNSSGR